MWISNTIIGLILLALAVAGVWRWYEAQSKNQKMETAAQEVRETAECHLEAFKLRPGLTETNLEVQIEGDPARVTQLINSIKVQHRQPLGDEVANPLPK